MGLELSRQCIAGSPTEMRSGLTQSTFC